MFKFLTVALLFLVRCGTLLLFVASPSCSLFVVLVAFKVAADNADKELQDTGIVFGAVYTVLRVVEIEGHRLIQLRNPPGNHGEWQGDWVRDIPLKDFVLFHPLVLPNNLS